MRKAAQQIRQSAVYERWQWFRTKQAARKDDGRFDNLRYFAQFIGHGRSSHSLVAALYDAHPQVIMADETDALRYVEAGFSRTQLFSFLAIAAEKHARQNRQKHGPSKKLYRYAVPGQWQGRTKRPQVIGEASLATARLYDNPDLLTRLQMLVQCPVRFIQVVRNPFDAIARLHILTGLPLDKGTEHYFWVCQRTAEIRSRLAQTALLLLRNEALIKNPEQNLTRMCTFFELDAPDDYLKACSSIIYKQPNQVRREISWTAEQKKQISNQIELYDFLSDYTFENS